MKDKVDKRKDEAHIKSIQMKRKATSDRRKNMKSLSAELKIDTKYLSKQRLNRLNSMFWEASKYYNWLLTQYSESKKNNTNFKHSTKMKDITIVKYVNKEKVEEPYTIQYLPSYMLSSINDDAIQSMKALKASKAKGRKVGYLKFKKYDEYNSLTIGSVYICPSKGKQNSDWILKKESLDGSIINVKNKNSKFIKITSLGKFRVFGINQIKDGAEIRNAKLIRKSSGFYIYLNTSIPHKHEVPNGKVIGIDMGISTAITTSDGEKFSAFIPEPKRLKRLQRKAARQEAKRIEEGRSKNQKSNRHKRTEKEIKKEYEKLVNKRNVAAINLHNYLKNKYSTIVIQDEMITGWKHLFGRKVQNSILGRFKQKIKNDSNFSFSSIEKAIVIDKKYPTTKKCKCGFKVDIKLGETVFKCPKCGYTEDRDIKAAKIIKDLGTGALQW